MVMESMKWGNQALGSDSSSVNNSGAGGGSFRTLGSSPPALMTPEAIMNSRQYQAVLDQCERLKKRLRQEAGGGDTDGSGGADGVTGGGGGGSAYSALRLRYEHQRMELISLREVVAQYDQCAVEDLVAEFDSINRNE